MLVAAPAAILYRCSQTRPQDPNNFGHKPTFTSDSEPAIEARLRKCVALQGTNLTRQPGANMNRGSDPERSTKRSGVLPIRRHPPGLATGYTPVWWPAIPIEPLWTLGLGTARRGTAIRSSTIPMNGKPGVKPKK